MSTQTMLFVPLLMVIGGLFHIIPGLTRPDLFFAVTVAPEFRRSSAARRTQGRYRAIVWIATLMASGLVLASDMPVAAVLRSEEHTSELQSLRHLVCRLLLEK